MGSQLRFCEVQLSEHSDVKRWQKLTVDDEGARQSVTTCPSVKDRAGGVVMNQLNESTFMLYWRASENTVELIADGLANNIDSGCLRIVCPDSNIAGCVSVVPLDTGVLVMFATSYAVHVVEANMQKSGVCLLHNIAHRQSYPVMASSPVTEFDGLVCNKAVVCALTKMDGTAVLATITHGTSNLSEIELKHSSLMNSLWSGMRRSMLRAPEEKGDTVQCVLVTAGEETTLYMLTKNLRLKKWSSVTGDCTSEWNLLDYVAQHGATTYALSLRKMIFQGRSVLGVQFVVGSHKKILVVNIDAAVATEKISIISTLTCGEEEVVSFELITDVLHVLCKNSDGESVIKYSQITENCGDWKFVHMQDYLASEVEVPDYADPRETFTEFLFHPYRFNAEAVRKAISVMSQDEHSDRLDNENINQLKWSATEAVETEIRSYVYDDEITNADYRKVQLQVWQKFASNVVQYHEVYTQAVGLANGAGRLPNCLVRKASISFLRLCDPLELQVLFPNDCIDPNDPLAEDVVTVAQALARIRILLPGFETTVYKALTNGIGANDICQKFHATLISHPEHTSLEDFLQNIDNIMGSFNIFAIMLDLVRDVPEQMTDTVVDKNVLSEMSASGKKLLCSAMEAMINSRFNVTCALTVFTAYILQLHKDMDIPQNEINEMEDLLARLCTLLHAYSVVLWTCRLPVPENTVDISASMMDALKITNPDGLDVILSQDSGLSNAAQPLLEEFLSGVGGMKVSTLLSDHPLDNTDDFTVSFARFVQAAAQTIWPISADMLLPEYMMMKNHPLILQSYCHLLQHWEKQAPCSRAFLLGHCHLQQGEPNKAFACFEAALYGMFNEEYFQSRLGIHVDDMTEEQVQNEQTKYCLTVINLFESLSYSEQVIQMAHKTIQFSEGCKSAPVPTLWSKIFKHCMDLDLFDESYKAMLTNPDYDRKMDCLRRFVVTLCDRELFKSLVSYPYKDMHTQRDLRSEVIKILTDKARSVDLTVSNYYDLLYSFHVYNQDLRSAAAVMYECAERLSQELGGQVALEKRAKCYLACIASLSCVKQDYAWLETSKHSGARNERMFSKRSNGGEQMDRVPPKIKIVTLEEIEKEYMLINIKLKLSKASSKIADTSESATEASELVIPLCTIGMYDEALELSRVYQLELSPIFESITHRCVRMSKDGNNVMHSENDEQANWLAHNQLPVEHSYAGYKEQAWNLLRSYLMSRESLTKYHRCVASKLLAYGVTLPEWFIASYKMKNAAELLHLYMKHDKLEESVNLVIEYFQALSGSGYERFGLEGPLSGTMNPSSLWVPYTDIDILLKVLEECPQDEYISELHNSLKEAKDQYLRDLEEKSQDACNRLQKSAHTRMQVSY